jgi:L-asparagine transporter-like permease
MGNMKSKTYSGKVIKEKRQGELNSYSLAGIGIGGIVGAGFFLGSGLAINQAGPSVIVAFLFGGLIMSQVLGAMTSISINRPVRGSFRVYTEEFLGQYAGFVLGWVVFASGILTLSSEAIAAGVFLRYWLPQIPIAVFALVVLFLVIGVNMLGTRNFGYIESGMASIKIGILVVFILLGGLFLYLNGMGQVSNPFSSINAFFPNGFAGFLQSMLVVIFTYSGISAVAMATSEVKNPHRDIPRATVLTTLGVVTLYTLSIAAIVFIVRWNVISTDVSPFVQAFNNMGLYFMSSIMNAVIFIAALSVMIATYFACTQILVSLSEARKTPEILKKRTGKNLFKNAWLAVGISSLIVVALSFVLGSRLFNYLISASSYFSFFNWVVNLITYLVWLKHRSSSEIYDSPLIWGRKGAVATLILIAVMFVMSLRVTDFRMGFYAAVGILAAISISYKILGSKRQSA